MGWMSELVVKAELETARKAGFGTIEGHQHHLRQVEREEAKRRFAALNARWYGVDEAISSAIERLLEAESLVTTCRAELSAAKLRLSQLSAKREAAKRATAVKASALNAALAYAASCRATAVSLIAEEATMLPALHKLAAKF